MNTKTSTEMIMEILSEEWPLKAQQIYQRQKREGKETSYQATHKTLQQLIEKKILKKMKKAIN